MSPIRIDKKTGEWAALVFFEELREGQVIPPTAAEARHFVDMATDILVARRAKALFLQAGRPDLQAPKRATAREADAFRRGLIERINAHLGLNRLSVESAARQVDPAIVIPGSIAV